jgi:hypothetical protein
METTTLAIVNGMIWDATHVPFLGSVICTGHTITRIIPGVLSNLPFKSQIIDAQAVRLSQRSQTVACTCQVLFDLPLQLISAIRPHLQMPFHCLSLDRSNANPMNGVSA